MRILPLLPLLVIALSACMSPARTSPSDQNPTLFIVHVDGKAGFMDRGGQLVIQPHYAVALPFSEGLAAVRVGDMSTGRWGYVNAAGHLEIEARFVTAGPFSNGLALINASTDDAAYIDRSGRVTITSKQVSIDGQSPRFTEPFREGLAPIVFDAAGSVVKSGYMSVEGKIAIEPRFASAFGFQGGRAQVLLSEQPGRSVFIDKSGNLLGPPFEICAPLLDTGLEFSEDYAAARVDCKGKSGYVDRTGRFQILPEFRTAGTFHSDLARVQLDPGNLYGYIHKTGILVVYPRFVEAESFSEGFAAVKAGAKWGFIDSTGHLAIPAKFGGAHSFSGGLAEVAMGKAWGYIDRTGEFVWKPTY